MNFWPNFSFTRADEFCADLSLVNDILTITSAYLEIVHYECARIWSVCGVHLGAVFRVFGYMSGSFKSIFRQRKVEVLEPPAKEKPLMRILEPRVLLDAAAVETAVDVLDKPSTNNLPMNMLKIQSWPKQVSHLQRKTSTLTIQQHLKLMMKLKDLQRHAEPIERLFSLMLAWKTANP